MKCLKRWFPKILRWLWLLSPCVVILCMCACCGAFPVIFAIQDWRGSSKIEQTYEKIAHPPESVALVSGKAKTESSPAFLINCHTVNHGGVFGTNFVAEKVSEYYQGEVRSIADNKIELVTEERLYYSLIGETYFDLWFEPSYGMVQRAFPDISPSQYETFTSQYETVYLVLVFYPVPC